jgi:hypothetical protein
MDYSADRDKSNFATVALGSTPSNAAEPLPQTGRHLANGKEVDTETRLT